MKTCPTCGEVKPRDAYWRDRKRGDGLFYDCKSCAQARNTRWVRGNREAVNQRALPSRHRYLSGLSNEGKVLAAARWRAAREGVGFSLVEADIAVPAMCPALGIPLRSHMGEGGTPGARRHSPTLARINDALGYLPGNVLVVSSKAKRTGAYRRLICGHEGREGAGSRNPDLEQT